MPKPLIIVESPTKIKTLKKFLGDGFSFESSIGHIRDLPAKRFGIDIENSFEPEYDILEGKKEVVDNIKKAAKAAKIVYLSSDPDREGEAIAWHLAAILPKGVKFKRVPFNEFTKKAVEYAIEHPRDIDLNQVNAQQARRLLDRMVGYKISPILQRKIGRGSKTGSLSAGRVQSVALRFVVVREREIEAFVPIEYWTLGANLSKNPNEKEFVSNLYSVDGKRVDKEKKEKKEIFIIDNEKTALEIRKKLEAASYKIAKVDRKEKKRRPVPPFITSTLQQEAARHYGFSATRTMSIAQSLYEGVEMGKDGGEGLITYMRTDSTRLSPEALSLARVVIEEKWGKEYLAEKPVQYNTKKGAQDAHEAIRPTNLQFSPESIKSHLTVDQYKLYLLIWRRFFATQMKPAIYDTLSYDISTDQNLMLRSTGSVIKFKGFLIAYEEKQDDGEDTSHAVEKLLPDLSEGTSLSFHQAFANQSFTKPPPRYTEASLVKELEKSGIGRPSTYSAIMQKILSRSYTTKERGSLRPTELGVIICQMLEDSFPNIINASFTAKMEEQLDEIAEKDSDWLKYIGKFWEEFYPTVKTAEKEAHVPKVMTDKKCPDCGEPLQKIWSRDKYFYGCSKYPDCKYTAPLEELTYNKEEYSPDFNWDQECPKCKGEMKVRKSRYGIFLGCTKYPECRGIVNIPKLGEIAPENLPACLAIGCDGQIVQRRSRFGKTFFSCSNFPDCNVIANSIEELDTKYQNHPKTAYEGKKGRKKAPAKKGASATKKKTTKGKAAAKKAAPKKKASDKPKTPRKQPVYQTTEILQAIVGEGDLSRQEVIKRTWAYIKSNDLQSPENKRLIVPDKNLEKLFGDSDPIDMMKLSGFISKHLKK